MGLLSRAKASFLLVWSNVTVEPVVVLYMMAYGLNEVTDKLN
jgi:hypothetical protein